MEVNYIRTGEEVTRTGNGGIEDGVVNNVHYLEMEGGEEKLTFKDDETYYIEVISRKYLNLFTFGSKHKVLGKRIPTYLTSYDIKEITKEEFEEAEKIEEVNKFEEEDFDDMNADEVIEFIKKYYSLKPIPEELQLILKKKREEETPPNLPKTTQDETEEAITELNARADIKPKVKSYVEGLLENKEPEFKSLGIGIHTDIKGEEYLYFGSKVYKGSKSTDAIVKSTREIKVNYFPFSEEDNSLPNEIKQEGINYRYPFIASVLDYTWSNDSSEYSVKQFCFGEKLNPSLKECYEDTYTNFKEHMDFQDEEMYISKSCSVVSSYFLPVFDAKARDYDNAEKGSGKTRDATLYSLQMFNPLMTSDIPKAAMFRIIEGTSASLIIDDFDSIGEEQKVDQIQIIRTGYKKGLKTVRCGRDSGFTPQPYSIYNSMVINNVGGLDDITQDRCNVYYLVKSTNKKVQDKRLDEKNKKWQIQRDKKYYSALLHWKDVRDTYNNLKIEGAYGRDLEKIAPIITVAKLVLDEKTLKKLIKYEINKLEVQKDRDVSSDWLFIALQDLVKIMADSTENEQKMGVAVRADRLVRGVLHQLYSKEDRDYEKKRRGISNYLGKTFKNTPLFESSKVHGGFVQYIFTAKNLNKFIEIRDYTNYFTDNELLPPSNPTNPSIPSNPTNPSIPIIKIK